MKIWFDMDGTIADLYNVPNWLESLRAEDASPYLNARVMLNFSALARVLNRVQKAGYEIGIISWTSKVSSEEYHEAVVAAKTTWLEKHLPSVQWDELAIVHYGVDKTSFKSSDTNILFDDDIRNREAWGKNAFEPDYIMLVLRELLA